VSALSPAAFTNKAERGSASCPNEFAPACLRACVPSQRKLERFQLSHEERVAMIDHQEQGIELVIRNIVDLLVSDQLRSQNGESSFCQLCAPKEQVVAR
jgi:hypothetical protein